MSVVVLPVADQTLPDVGVFVMQDWAEALMHTVASAMHANRRIHVRSADPCQRLLIFMRAAYCDTSIAVR